MKTKLLRKVRKQYSIQYYLRTNKIIVEQHLIGVNIELYSITVGAFYSKEEAYKECLNQLQKCIVTAYQSQSTRRNKSIKLWYNPSK